MIERILTQTRVSIEQRRRSRSIDELRAVAVPTRRSLASALERERSTIILECKKASPSEGLIRPNFDISEIVNAYEPFADAISVITNSDFFGGDLNFLCQAREHTNKPLLCKDFILTPYQVFEARCFEADAVLLMMSLLNDNDFRLCFDAAASLHMDVLVETHDETELKRALALGAKIIGVNNRDFRTLKVDLNTAERLLPQIPKDKITVFESGISTHEQLRSYRSLADAFLIGTSLMKQPALPKAVRELIFGRVKVCGLTRHEDAINAHKNGAALGGLIFASESPRCVSLTQAQDIRANIDLAFVGVFVNQPAALIGEYATRLGLSAIQLHGEEDALFVQVLRGKLPSSCEIWKAVRIQDHIPSPREFGCDRILLDAFDSNRRGGTGQRFDWEKINSLNSKESYILSGGLSPEIAKEADTQGLWALDVNSGVEKSPGIKSDSLLHAFFGALR